MNIQEVSYGHLVVAAEEPQQEQWQDPAWYLPAGLS